MPTVTPDTASLTLTTHAPVAQPSGIVVTVRNGGAVDSDTVNITDRVRTDLDAVKIGTRAHMGESSQSTLIVDDDNGEYGNSSGLPVGLSMLSIAAHNVVTVTETATNPATVLVRGRVIPKEIERADLGYMDRGRQITLRLDDNNADLKGLDFLTAQVRPSETDVARVTWIFDTFLSGSPRLTTELISGIVAGNTVTMEAITYPVGTKVLDVLSECATAAEKTFFVMPNGVFYYAPIDDTSQLAGIRISDRLDELDTEGVCSGSVPTVTDTASFQSVSNGFSVPVTVGSATNRVLYAAILYYGGGPDDLSAAGAAVWYPSYIDSSTTGAGQTMTLIASDTHVIDAGPNTGRLAIYRVTAPNTSTIGTSAVEFTFGTAGMAHGYAWAMSGVDQSTPEVNVDVTSGTGTGSSVALSAGGVVLDVSGWVEGDATLSVPSPTSGQTVVEDETTDRPIGQGDMASAAGVGTAATSTYGFGTSRTWLAGAISVQSDTAAASLTFPPIWDFGPASTEFGQDLLSGGILRYDGDQFVTETRPTVADDYDYYVDTINDDRVSGAAAAAARLSAQLNVRQYEERTYTVAVQLHRTQVGCVMAGQMIYIKARAIPDADDAFVQRRIASLEWQLLTPEHYLAVMELDRPLRIGGRSGSGAAAQALATAPKKAGMISVADAGDYFTGTDVEAALQELGAAGTTVGWFNVKDYGAIGDGTTDDTTAINSAIAAYNTAGGGVLYFPAGHYQTTGALTSITAGGLILGDGHAHRDGTTQAVSRIDCSSATASLFTIAAHATTIRGLALVNDAGSAPTAGAGITVTSGGHARYENLSVSGFYVDIDIQDGEHWAMSGCYIYNSVSHGIKIAHTDLPDGGDWSISDSWITAAARTAAGANAIHQISGGGGKITNLKVNADAAVQYTDGIRTAIPTAVSTSILAISNSSIENISGDAISVSTTGTGRFAHVIVNGVQVGLYSNNTGRTVKISAASAGGNVDGGIFSVIIDGLIARTNGTARAAVELVNTDNVTLGEINLVGFNARYTSSGDTNTSDAGVSGLNDLSDVTITAAVTGDMLRYNGTAWVDTPGRWEVVTNGTDILVWDGVNLLHEWTDT